MIEITRPSPLGIGLDDRTRQVKHVRERFLRIESIGMPTANLAQWLGVSEMTLARWIKGSLPTDEADVVEVGLSLLEMRIRLDESWNARFAPTLRLAPV